MINFIAKNSLILVLTDDPGAGPNTAWIIKTWFGRRNFCQILYVLYRWKACQNPVILIPHFVKFGYKYKNRGWALIRVCLAIYRWEAGSSEGDCVQICDTNPNWGTHSRSWKHSSPFHFDNYAYLQRKRKSSFPAEGQIKAYTRSPKFYIFILISQMRYQNDRISTSFPLI